MDAFELRHDIQELAMIMATLLRAAEQERPLTHSQRTVLIRATMILLEDMRSEKEAELARIIHQPDGIPF